jgi:folate-dependent phosphoribosylglycinamide formyltransferase PurN
MHPLPPPRFSGPTVHFVDEEFDTGPILAQRVVPVDPLESHKSLAAKVLKQVSLAFTPLVLPAWLLVGAGAAPQVV